MKQDTVDQHCRFDESFCHLFCFSSGRFLLLLFHHETMLGLNTDTYIQWYNIDSLPVFQQVVLNDMMVVSNACPVWWRYI